MTSALELKNLSVSYAHVEAVAGVDMTIDEGQVTTLVGANGAGKTSLLSALMGVLPHKGEILLRGEYITALPVERRVEQGISLVSESRDLFGSMSVEDNLRLGGYMTNRAGSEGALKDVYHRFPKLRERHRQKAATLSGGERQMLAMGRALMANPRILLLDEPSLGLAPMIVRDVFSIIRELQQDGQTILLVEQNAKAALQVAHRAYVMETGRIAKQGLARELIDDKDLVAIYLGGHVHQAEVTP